MLDKPSEANNCEKLRLIIAKYASKPRGIVNLPLHRLTLRSLQDGDTPLHLAIRKKKAMITQLLVERGANLDAANEVVLHHFLTLPFARLVERGIEMIK
jgi:ankyrin repeat protein